MVCASTGSITERDGNSLNEIKQSYLDVIQENKFLKDLVDNLQNEVEDKDSKIRELEIRVKSHNLDDFGQPRNQQQQVNNIIKSFDFSNMSINIKQLLEEKTDDKDEALKQQNDELENEMIQLKNQIEICQQEKNNKVEIITQLREENENLQNKNKRWISKLDEEINKNAGNVQNLTQQI